MVIHFGKLYRKITTNFHSSPKYHAIGEKCSTYWILYVSRKRILTSQEKMAHAKTVIIV